jgi:predicted MFS family arabinose efflux permease
MVSVPVLVTLTDRVDPKRVYLFGVGCTTVAHFAFGLLADGFWSALLPARPGRHRLGRHLHDRLKLLADQVDAKMMSRAVTGHAASIGISGAASYVLGEVLAQAFGWRLAFASAGLTAAIAWITVALAVPGRPPPPAKLPASRRCSTSARCCATARPSPTRWPTACTRWR